MALSNCWEAKRCGREPGGAKARERGPCLAATAEIADGYLGGRNGGRACAFVVGTLQDGVRAECAAQLGSCFLCDFFQALVREEPLDFNVLAYVHFTFEKRRKAEAEAAPTPA